MTLEVRRIVTGHNEFGMGIVVSDEKLSAVSRGLGANISGCEIWSTNSMPVDNSMEAETAQRAGFVKKYNYVGSGQGTTVRIVEWAPGHGMFWHRTETVDYSMVLSGEIDVEFDSDLAVGTFTDGISGLHTGLLFGPDALPKTHSLSTIMHD